MPPDSPERTFIYLSIIYNFFEDKVRRGGTALNKVLEARVGIEPAYTALQAAA
jgi:hypothetical protein